MKDYKEFLNYLVNELKWPYSNAKDWCNYLLNNGYLVKGEEK